MDPPSLSNDWNSNTIWHRPGRRNNHVTKVRLLSQMGLASAYHHLRREAHGQETIPTHYWRDRREDGPTHHIDYVFLPSAWLANVTHLEVGRFADWCGSGMSDHVPIVLDLSLAVLGCGGENSRCPSSSHRSRPARSRDRQPARFSWPRATIKWRRRFPSGPYPPRTTSWTRMPLPCSNTWSV